MVAMSSTGAGSEISGQPKGLIKPEWLDLYKSAYEEGRRLVDDQATQLDGMRQRAVQFLAFVGASTAFLVGSALSHMNAADIPPVRTWPFFLLAGGATTLSVVAVLLCVSVLLSWTRLSSRDDDEGFVETWHLKMRPGQVLWFLEPPPGTTALTGRSLANVYQALARRYQQMADQNEEGLRRVRNRYLWLLLVGFFQLACWLTFTWVFA